MAAVESHLPVRDVEGQSESTEDHEGLIQANVGYSLRNSLDVVKSCDSQELLVPERRSCRFGS